MTEFSELVYRGFGKHQRKGGGFDFAPAKSQEEFESLLSDGWFATLPEAIEAHDNPKKVEVKEPEDKSAPTRAEMEIKARKLGIRFDGRTSNVKLLTLINEEIG